VPFPVLTLASTIENENENENFQWQYPRGAFPPCHNMPSMRIKQIKSRRWAAAITHKRFITTRQRSPIFIHVCPCLREQLYNFKQRSLDCVIERILAKPEEEGAGGE